MAFTVRYGRAVCLRCGLSCDDRAAAKVKHEGECARALASQRNRKDVR